MELLKKKKKEGGKEKKKYIYFYPLTPKFSLLPLTHTPVVPTFLQMAVQDHQEQTSQSGGGRSAEAAQSWLHCSSQKGHFRATEVCFLFFPTKQRVKGRFLLGGEAQI
jgi:hypothetical protein